MDIVNIVNNIAKEAEKNTAVNDGDYTGEDGLLVCGKCHTPKQVRVEFLGQEKTPFCLCKCEKEKRDAEEASRQKAALEKRIAHNKLNAFPDVDSSVEPEDDMRNWTFEKDNHRKPQYTEAAKKYVENFETFKRQGKGLLLYGDVGTGKSFMSCCIANALLDKGYRVLVTTFSRIEKTMFGMKGDRQEYLDSLNRYDLLVLDDLGAERDTEYMNEIVYNVIDGRSRINLPLIVTSNITAHELKNPKDTNSKRIISRLLKMCHPIKVDGEDMRKQAAVESFAATKAILGI
jgi:DNA replication protein DnaC